MARGKRPVHRETSPDLGITFTITGPAGPSDGDDFDDFYTKIVGVTFNNRDGRNRQDVVRELRCGQELFLHREYKNEHDAEAIAVATAEKVRVGYIHANLADRLAPVIDAGARFNVVVSSLTGGDQENLGVNIRIRMTDGPTGVVGSVSSRTRGRAPGKPKRVVGCGCLTLILFFVIGIVAMAIWRGTH